jgi:hypothetical protein
VDLRIALACLALGAVTEAVSAGLGLWLYDPPWLRLANVVLGFGVLFGWVSSALGESPSAVRFLVGAAVGTAYEALNLTVVHAWSFPQDRLLLLHGPIALVLGVGITWGFLPLVVPRVVAR